MKGKNIFLCILMVIGFLSLPVGAVKVDGFVEGSLEWAISEDIYFDWQGVVDVEGQIVKLRFGQERLEWGQGQTGNLVFSDTSLAMPILRYEVEVGPFNYTRFMSPLERDVNRWLFGQRLEAEYRGFQGAVWELMMGSNRIYPLYFVPVPLVPLYGIQHISYKLSDVQYDFGSNVMFGFDGEYQWGNGFEVYGQLLVDDFPQKQEYGNPRKIAGLVGLLFADSAKNRTIWAEYVRVNNFVYTHKNVQNQFLYKGRSLGHFLGMDGDLLAVGVERQVDPKNEMEWQVGVMRKGEGDFGDNWNSKLGNDYEFLTGVVTTTASVSLEWTHHLAENLQINLHTYLGREHNADHQLNNDRNVYGLEAGITYFANFEKLLGSKKDL